MNRHNIVSNKESEIKTDTVVVVNATKHHEKYEIEHELLKIWADKIASKVSDVIE